MIDPRQDDGAVWRRLGAGPAALAGRLGLAALAVAALGWLMVDRIAALDAAEIARRLSETPVAALAAALAWSALSHAATALYDPLAFARLGVRLPLRRAALGGFAASTLGQVLGFAPLVGAATRWRMHRGAGVGPALAAAASGLVVLGFFAGIAALLAALTLLHPAPVARLTGIAPDWAALAAALALAALILGVRWTRGRPLRLGTVEAAAPDLRWLGAATALTAVDLTAAAMVFWVLLPPDAAPPFAEALVVYVAALALGQASGAPAGFGAFEATLLLGLPGAPAEAVIAAAVVYRAVYLGPAGVMAALAALRAGPGVAGAASAAPPELVRAALAASPRAEGELAHLGDKRFFAAPDGAAFVMFGARGRDRVLMGDPFGPRAEWGPLVDRYLDRARAEGARVAVYKAEDAAFWAGRGFRLHPLGEEAWLVPAAFDLRTPCRREVRRKIGQARKAGVALLVHAPGAAPLDRLARVAEEWRTAKQGREMTFSMGHFAPGFLRRHEVHEARMDGRTVGFLTVWASGDGSERMIDLMRLAQGAPHGVMHALVAAAIEAAAAAGAARFNLCMAPLSGLERLAPATILSRAGHLIYEHADRRHGLKGLRRFKEAFRPEWTPRYLAAGGALSAAMALAAVRGLVNAPLPAIDADGLAAAQAFLDADADAPTLRETPVAAVA